MKTKLVLFLFFLSAFMFVFMHKTYAGVNIFEVPRTLPESKIIGQNGQIFKLSDFKGEFILAHFWSRDCAPCIKELKGLNKFHNEVKDYGIRLIMISPQSEWFDLEEQRKFLKRFGATDLEFYVEQNDNLSADFGIFTTPHTVIINKQGKEAGRLKGSETWDKTKVIKFIKNLKEQME